MVPPADHGHVINGFTPDYPHPGGAPCNVATSLGKLGLDVVFATALGRDERGDTLMAIIQGEKEDTFGSSRIYPDIIGSDWI